MAGRDWSVHRCCRCAPGRGPSGRGRPGFDRLRCIAGRVGDASPSHLGSVARSASGPDRPRRRPRRRPPRPPTAPAVSTVGTGSLASFYRPRPATPTPPADDHPGQALIPSLRSAPGRGPGLPGALPLPVASGGDLAESGVVVVPGGTPPVGWLPHRELGPRDHRRGHRHAPRRSTAPRPIPDLVATARSREIVAATDYRGLGRPGVASLPGGHSEAEDVLDAARAARSLVGRCRVQHRGRPRATPRAARRRCSPGRSPRPTPPSSFMAGVAAVGAGDLGARAGADRSHLATPPRPVGLHRHGPLRLVARTTGTSRSQRCSPPAGLDRILGRVLVVRRRGGLALRRRADRALLPARMGAQARRPGRQPGQPAGRRPDSAPILVVQGTADEWSPTARPPVSSTRQLCRGQYDSVDYVADAGRRPQPGALQDAARRSSSGGSRSRLGRGRSPRSTRARR